MKPLQTSLNKGSKMKPLQTFIKQGITNTLALPIDKMPVKSVPI
jgi:hypothetical protein